MNLINSFTFVTKDPSWFKKMFIGAIVTAIPFFGGAASNGYQMEVLKNLLKRSPVPLPEWENLGKMFTNGLQLLLAIYVLYIPGVILFVIGWILGLSKIFTILMMLFDASYQTRMGVNVGVYIGRELISLLLGVILGLVLPLSFLFVPAMLRRCAKYNTFSSAFNFPAHLKFILRHLGDYVMAFIAVMVTLFLFSFVSSFVGGITIWIAGLGALIGWFGVALGRFWGRMMWAYNLAEMEFKTIADNQTK
jgi:Protein of unknown function (DUF4013)